MRTTTLVRILLFFSLALLSGCSKSTTRPTSSGTADSSHFAILEQTSKESGWKGILSFTPTVATSDKEMTFNLKLTDSSGQPLDGAQVRFALIMPLMDMGKTEFETTPQGGGLYSGKGEFSMDGIWIVQATIQKNQQKGSMEFEIHVNEP